MAVDATAEFDDVQGIFSSSSSPILTLLRDIADNASQKIVADTVAIDYLSDVEIESADGSANVPAVPDITAVTPGDIGLFTQATDYLDELRAQALVGATFPSYLTLEGEVPDPPVMNTVEPTLYAIQEIPDPGLTIPVWDDSSAWSGGDISLDGTIGPLVKPFAWTGGSYTSQMLNGGVNVVYEAIKADLIASDYGIGNLDEGHVFDRAVEREERAFNATYEESMRVFSSGGFFYPTPGATGAVLRALNEKREKISSASRDIMIKKADLLLEAKKIAQANGIAVEQLEQGFFNAEADRLLKRIAQEITSTVEVATFNVERIKMYIAKYEGFARVFAEQIKGALGTVDIFKAQVEAEGTKAQVNKTLVDIFVEKNKALIDEYLGQLKGLETIMDGRVKYHGVLADVYKSQVSQINAHTDATKEAFSLVDKQYKTAVEYAVGKYNGDINKTKTKLDEILGFLNYRMEQLKSQAQTAASVAASAMSALNVNLGLSLGASTSISGSESESTDKSASTPRTTNSHSWDETKREESRSHQVIEQTSESDSTSTNTNRNYNYTS